MTKRNDDLKRELHRLDPVEPGELEHAAESATAAELLARIVSTGTPPHLAALIADGTVRAPEGPRYLPAKPAKLKGEGKSAAEYVSEGRR